MLYVDGGCSGNNQLDLSKRSMVAMVTNDRGEVLVEESSTGGGSNNIAELWAVVLALDWCAFNAVSVVTIYTDSRNNLSWVCSKKKVGQFVNDQDAVIRLKEAVARHLLGLSLKLEWVPREKNLAGHAIEAKYGL